MADHGESGKGLNEFVFFGILGVGLIFGLWFALRTPIMWISFYCSYYTFMVYEHLSWLMTSTELSNIIAARKAIPKLNPTQYGISSLMMLFEYHGYVWRWIVVPGLLWWGWRTKQGVVRFKFRREISDVYKLIDIQARHFPASAIIRGKNLLATHPYVGPWATYMLPVDFAVEHQLLWTSKQSVTEEDRVDERKMMPIPPFTPDQKLMPFPQKRRLLPSHRYVLLHLDRANETFAKQLGPQWKGHDHLPPLERALFAAFCAQANGAQDKAWKMIEQLAFSFKEGVRDKSGQLVTPHHANTDGADELIKQYASTPVIQNIIMLHAHTINVMTAALKAARKKGRMMHSNFLWLKPVNRELWYALCGQGGQSAYWEAAGAWAHAEIEELMGKKIVVPMVAGAVEALRELMSREHWIDPAEFSEAAQQRLVAEANALLDAERERSKANQRPAGMFGAGQPYRQPTPKKTRKEDDEP
jgi:intracellular multiplication protein IcmP